MPRLLDVDKGQERLLKEYIPGDTVDKWVMEDRLPEVCWQQIRDICRILYGAGLNIDYYPTNFIPWNGTLYYIDYECNLYDDRWNFENWGNQYWWKSSAFLDAFGK